MDIDLEEKGRFWLIEEGARYEQNVRAMESKMLMISEGCDIAERRNVEYLREYEGKEKRWLNIIVKLEAELDGVKHEVLHLNRGIEELKRENERLAVDEGYLIEAESRLKKDIDEMHQKIREKKLNIKDNVNEVIDQGIKEEKIIDETRYDNEHKIKDLEHRLREAVCRKEDIRIRMESIIQQVNFNVSNVVYNTFINTDFLKDKYDKDYNREVKNNA